MAKPVKTTGGATGINTSLSREEIGKAIKAIKGTQSIIGKDEIQTFCSVKKIRTDLPTIDYMGGGGITQGGITIFAGAPSAGKSTGSLMIEKRLIEHHSALGDNRLVLHFDVERAMDYTYATTLGVDCDGLCIRRTNVIEDAFKQAEELIVAGFVHSIVIDSLDNMVSKKANDNSYSATMGGTAGALAAYLPMLHSKIIEYDITTIIIKQARVKLDAYGAKGEVLTFNGGKALRHACDSIFIMKPLSHTNLEYKPVRIKAEKTRSPRMGMTLDMPMHLNAAGFDTVRDLMGLSVEHGLIDKAGAWYNYKDNKVQGEEKLYALFMEKPELVSELKERFYSEIVEGSAMCTSVEAFATEELEG